MSGNLAIATNKFTVDASSGTLAVNTNSFTVNGANGNTEVGGTLGVSSTLSVGPSGGRKITIAGDSGNVQTEGILAIAGSHADTSKELYDELFQQERKFISYEYFTAHVCSLDYDDLVYGNDRLSALVVKHPETKDGLTRYLYEIILRRMEIRDESRSVNSVDIVFNFDCIGFTGTPFLDNYPTYAYLRSQRQDQIAKRRGMATSGGAKPKAKAGAQSKGVQMKPRLQVAAGGKKNRVWRAWWDIVHLMSVRAIVLCREREMNDL